jgi:hypothetical protein
MYATVQGSSHCGEYQYIPQRLDPLEPHIKHSEVYVCTRLITYEKPWALGNSLNLR